jgi:hypothetical protein
MTSEGFVMAMQGELILQPWPWTEEARRLASTWFLTSRSGPGGRLLLIGWTGRATAELPDFQPRRTLVALLQPGAADDGAARFALLQACPEDISVAGRVQPAEGMAYLSKQTDRRVLRVEAWLPRGQYCRIAATQRPWIGELDDEA